MSMRQTLAAVGVAAAIAGLGGATVYAATDGGDMPHRMGGPPRGGMGSVDPATVHAEAVVADGHGGYTTTITQTGTITDLSATSITVRSDDGYRQTYVLPSGIRPPADVNDAVSVRATRTGPTATVTTFDEPGQLP
ncbi:hypothetical protein ACWDTP_14775 [Mycobacterium sp. NPDC003449]